MDKKISATILFIGLIANAVSLPRRCRYIRSQRKVECKLARLYQTIKSLDIPWEVKIVSLTNNELTNAPEIAKQLEHLEYLTSLDLSYNSIAKGLRNVVSKSANLKEFRIRNNLLRSIDERIFENNPKLEKVDLSNNMLGTLPRRLFHSNPSLQSVMLWANDLTKVPEDLFRTNKELEVINLSWNKLTDIPETFFRGLTNLKKVIIWKNQLTCLYRSMFQDNTKLSTFHAAINYIKKVPDDIFDNNPELEDVRFWANKLECIPKRLFHNNEKIGYVNLLLGNDKLPWVLKQRFSKTGLHDILKMESEIKTHGNYSCTAAPCEWNPETLTMDCSHRELTDLSTLADVCEKVRNLNLDGNLLNDPGQLLVAMDSMRELRSVSAQENEMQGPIPPETFTNNPQLSDVDLSKNKISGIPVTTFEGNAILKTFNIADNLIEEIPDELFFNTPELAKVDMSRNKIKKLSKTVFSNSRMMTVAKLSKNKISKIDDETFKNTEKLRELDLSDNQLTGDMFMDTLENSPDLETVRLKGNRIAHMKKREDHKTLNKTLLLELSYNKLEEFPAKSIQARPYLQRLILDHNKIETIPETALHKNKELVEIDLSYNRLTELSNLTFSRNTKLEILRLDHNALTRLDKGLLDGNTHLKFFSANGNKIHFVSPILFIFNLFLEEVRLSDNVIEKLPDKLFHPMAENLRFLTMSKNYLDYLPRNIFTENDKLEHVCLYGNTLSKLKTTAAPKPIYTDDGVQPPGELRQDVPVQKRPWQDEYTYVTPDEIRMLKEWLRAADYKEDEQ